MCKTVSKNCHTCWQKVLKAAACFQGCCRVRGRSGSGPSCLQAHQRSRYYVTGCQVVFKPLLCKYRFTDPIRLDMPFSISIIKRQFSLITLQLNWLPDLFLIDKDCITSWLLFGFRVCADGTSLCNLLPSALDPLRKPDPSNNIFLLLFNVLLIYLSTCIWYEILSYKYRPYFNIYFYWELLVIYLVKSV